MPELTPSDILALLFQFAALCVVTLRLSWLVISDSITSAPREWVIGKLAMSGHAKAAGFFDCPFCAGFWATAILVLVLDLNDWMSFPLVVLWVPAINIVVAPAHHWLENYLDR